MLNIVVLVSGSGTNLGALIKSIQNGEIQNGKISLVVSSNPNAYAIERAKQNGIAAKVVDRKSFDLPCDFYNQLIEVVDSANPDLIVLAGFMCILPKEFIAKFKNKIINVHPSLIPSFCGEGYYGLKVHKAVLDYGVKLTGATVHFVNEIPDGGAIILQKSVEVKHDDTPEVLQKRVMEQAEWIILPQAVSLFCQGKIKLVGNKAIVESNN